jgi:hypothetical protein
VLCSLDFRREVCGLKYHKLTARILLTFSSIALRQFGVRFTALRVAYRSVNQPPSREDPKDSLVVKNSHPNCIKKWRFKPQEGGPLRKVSKSYNKS